MKLRLIAVTFFTVALSPMAALPPEYESLKAEAEKFYAEKSFAKAHELYSRAMEMSNITSNEARWVFFRNADTLWRSQAATESADTTKIDQAREGLEQLLRETKRVEDRDRTWVEAQESLGDFFWTRRNQQNWGQAWPCYQQALDWWAGARDIELARERYLGIVWRCAKPPGVQREYYYGYWGNFVPLDVLENALKIATSDEDKAHAHYLVAMTLRQQAGDPEQRARVVDEFEAGLKLGKKTDWYDDALYYFAEWMASQGRVVTLKDGNQTFEPDYVRALELFRQLVQEFAKGETRYWDQAQQQIKNITDPQIGVSVPNIFLPDSEIQYYLSWRNVKQIELALYPVELNRDVKLDEQGTHWLHSIDLGKLEKMKSWTRDTKDKGDYKPGNESVRIEEKLKPGAYVLEARAGGNTARELILVTDAAVVLKSSGRQALVYFCNALDSSPLAKGKVKLWERWRENNTWHVREQSKELDQSGLAVFDLTQPAQHSL
ncbi:MAG TPA: alpha-2-macroglobulin, partial [Verrucomicrobiae bacterium]|nr:alpha-2-macroglobulin [Verrucomicrobiae bacterium]